LDIALSYNECWLWILYILYKIYIYFSIHILGFIAPAGVIAHV